MLPDTQLVLRLLFAALLGSVIGVERERLAWTAGLRTHMLVCVGSCLAMIVSAYGFGDVLGPHVILDPSRIAAQVVSGIGFLGAGSIILRNEVVKGLTTAASLWAVAAVGLAAGGGLYVAAIAATVIIIIILAGLKPLEERYRRGRQTVELTLKAAHGAVTIGALENALGRRAGQVTRMVVCPGDPPDQDEVTVTIAKASARDVESVMEALRTLAAVSDISYISATG
jgi:putative Mg2+ transporter-C (MgtC) family protein